MKYKKRNTIFLLFLLGLGSLQAQEATVASGGEGTGVGGTVSFSLGQMAYQTYTGSSYTLAEGLQQAYEISTVSRFEELETELSVFPNPNTGLLTLRVEDQAFSKLSYQLYDMQGRLINQAPLLNYHTQIDMTSLRAGTYLLRVSNSQNQAKSYTILKH